MSHRDALLDIIYMFSFWYILFICLCVCEICMNLIVIFVLSIFICDVFLFSCAVSVYVWLVCDLCVIICNYVGLVCIMCDLCVIVCYVMVLLVVCEFVVACGENMYGVAVMMFWLLDDTATTGTDPGESVAATDVY